ncbi:MAG: DUF1569 domain-containing protein [Planctomycetota bacterium]
MPHLFDPVQRAIMKRRIDALQSDDRPAFGSLDAPRLLAHFIDSFAFTFAEKEEAVQTGLFATPIGRWLVISSPMPWPKGRVQAPASFFATACTDFQQDRERVQASLDRFAVGPDQSWGVSPGFGRLTPMQWARLNWRHCNHHLDQFGR